MKKIITILIILLGLTFTSFAQTKSAYSVDQPTKIIKYYPNPATTAINFEFQRGYDKSYTLQLYNFMGKKVTEVKITSSRINLPLIGFFRGFYYYRLLDKNGKILDSDKFQVIR